jgi:hypothetical protein
MTPAQRALRSQLRAGWTIMFGVLETTTRFGRDTKVSYRNMLVSPDGRRAPVNEHVLQALVRHGYVEKRARDPAPKPDSLAAFMAQQADAYESYALTAKGRAVDRADAAADREARE